jgi:hypothetical protein
VPVRVGYAPQTEEAELPMLLVPVERKPMFIASVPPVPAIVSEPRLTHTTDETEELEQEDSHHAFSIVPALSKNSTFCTPELR